MARQMKDSGIAWIGEIPEDWGIHTAFQLFSQVKNKNEGMHEDNLLSLSYGRIIKKNINATEGLLPESFEGYNIIEPNDIVLRLTDLQNDHTSLRVGISGQHGIITSAYLTLRNESDCFERYLYYQLHAFDICKGFYGMGAGVRQGLNWDGIKMLKIVRPPLSEQRRIAAFLDRRCAEIDAVIERTKATIEEYKKLKQAVITAAVTKGVRGPRPMKESGIEWIGEIPEGWSRDKVNRIFGIIGSGTTPKSDDESQYGGSINWIQSGDINGGILISCKNTISEQTLVHYSALKVYHAPFIIIAMYGASVGNASIVEISGCVNQACCVLGMCRCNLQYAFYAFKVAKEHLIQKAVGGGQPNISQDTLRSLWLPVPSSDEQDEIVAYLDEKCAALDTLIAKKTALLTELETYKKSLIYEYVTGKKEVPACP